MRSATDGRLEYPIGKDEARERPEMSTPVGCHIRSTSTDTSALSVTPFTVSRAHLPLARAFLNAAAVRCFACYFLH